LTFCFTTTPGLEGVGLRAALDDVGAGAGVNEAEAFVVVGATWSDDLRRFARLLLTFVFFNIVPFLVGGEIGLERSRTSFRFEVSADVAAVEPLTRRFLLLGFSLELLKILLVPEAFSLFLSWFALRP